LGPLKKGFAKRIGNFKKKWPWDKRQNSKARKEKREKSKLKKSGAQVSKLTKTFEKLAQGKPPRVWGIPPQTNNVAMGGGSCPPGMVTGKAILLKDGASPRMGPPTGLSPPIKPNAQVINKVNGKQPILAHRFLSGDWALKYSQPGKPNSPECNRFVLGGAQGGQK